MATTATLLVERLVDWGVSVVFGMPGDGINGIMEALRARQDRVRFVQVRHEEAAAFMACGYAKFTGRLGVCLATSGPGAIHLLNGLYAPLRARDGGVRQPPDGRHERSALGMIKWERMVFLGNPEYGVALQPIDSVRFAEACGGLGFRCATPAEVRPAPTAALAAKRPALVEAVVDPFEPPLPPRVSAEQALHMAEALVRGEPNRGRIALTLFRNKVRDLVGR
jgi:thiamine pyrophosphate-dependent acetolactate synthase large subunit-like protein